MSEGKNLRLGLVIEAIDKASAVIERVNERVESVTKPVNRVLARVHHLGEALRLEELHERTKAVGEAFERVNESGRRLFELEAYVGLAGGALVEFLKKTAETGEQIDVMSRRVGLSALEYQRLGFAALQSGVAQESAGEAIRFLNRNVVEALRGNMQLRETFHSIGISLDDLRHRSPLELFYKIADWMEKFPNRARDGYVAMGLLGKGGADVIPMLQKGSEALKELGDEAERHGLFSQDAIDSSKRFMEAYHNAAWSVKSLAYAVGADLLPEVTHLIDRFDAWTLKNRELVSTRLHQYLVPIIQDLPQLASAAGNIGLALLAIFEVVNKLANALGGWSKLIEIIAVVRIAQFVLALGGLAKAFFALGLFIMSTPVGWLLAALGLLGVAAYELIQHWEGFKKFWRELWYGLEDRVGAAVDWMLRKLEPLLHALHLISPDTYFSAPGAPPISPADQARIQRTIDASGLPRVVLGEPRRTLGAPASTQPGSPALQSIDVGGRLDIHIDDKGRARAKRIRANGPMDLSVSSGPLALGAAQ